jgi:hypothetical protein
MYLNGNLINGSVLLNENKSAEPTKEIIVRWILGKLFLRIKGRWNLLRIVPNCRLWYQQY